jgi:hypothetical protein
MAEHRDSDAALEFVTSEELVAELARRSVAAVVAWLPLTEQGRCAVRCSGSVVGIAGLAKVAKLHCDKTVREAMES